MIKNLKFDGEDGIDPTFLLPPADDYSDYKQYILSHTDFAAVLKVLKLRPQECITGKYTHKMTCPFKFHKNGRERTASFRINAEKNTFLCFRCSANGNILRFLQLYCGGADEYNLQRLAIMNGLVKDGQIQVPNNYVEPENTNSEHNESIFSFIFDASVLLRDFLTKFKGTNRYAEEMAWVDKAFIKLDEFFLSLKPDDAEKASKLIRDLKLTLEYRERLGIQ